MGDRVCARPLVCNNPCELGRQFGRGGRGRVVEPLLNGRRVLKVQLSGFADRSVEKEEWRSRKTPSILTMR